MQSKLYQRVTKSMMQKTSKKLSGVDELAFFALVYWLRQCGQSPEKMTALMQSDSWDEDVRTFLNQIVDDYSDLLFETAKAISDEELQDIINSISLYRGMLAAKRATPESAAELAMYLLQLRPGDNVADLCSGFGTFSIQICRHYPDVSCIAVDNDKTMYIGATIQINLMHSPVQTVCGDVLDANVLQGCKPVNKVFCHIPIGYRYRDMETWIRSYPEVNELFFNEKRNITGEWVFAAIAKIRCMPEGRVVLMMSGSGLSNNLDQSMRQEFLRRGWIETVIALPERLLPGCPASYMMVLSNGNETVRMVDATSFYKQEHRKMVLTREMIKQIQDCVDADTKQSCTLSMMQLAENQYILDPRQYLTETDERLNDSETLGTLCTITRGYVAKADAFEKLSSGEPTAYQYIRVQDMENGTVNPDLPYLKSGIPGSEASCVQSGDVLISKLTPFKTALIGDIGTKKILATENMYILRSHYNAIEPVYLMLYLQSELGMHELMFWAKGNYVQNLSIQNLKKVRIPVMDREKQKNIAMKYVILQKKRMETENQLKKIQKEMDDLLKQDMSE
ncbi:N-6 DNA methylase [uncultured Megasphaera sp.]|uniref:N-6 DNA methylase n=1 Tax=uncultured Megasphaera sp. TaxID=165188 RepID=UPI002616D31E|nr:N-6 DNA methylase [uncultured Megasphaera sp.]